MQDHDGVVTQTFLFTDIEGSTRLEQQVGSAAYGAIRERHRELLRAAFSVNDGVEQSTEGDSFFVVFPTARSGLVAAIDGQRAIAAEPWPEGVELRVRMGLHAGEASSVGGSLVGLDINRAARIAGAANGGQIVASETVQSLVGSELPEGVSMRPLGSHRLKDLRAPEPLAQVVAPGLPDRFPPLRSIDARPNNLPTQLTSFVGREAELAEAGRLLESSRLVTMTGPGGTGKTRLSLQVANAAMERFPDGVFFVPLETVREPALAPARIAAAIGLAESNRPALELLIEWLASRRVLLVLDNLEQVVGVGPIVTDLLRAAPGLSVLATSRSPLHVSGEQEYQVPGLPVPPAPSELSAVERLRLGAAAELDPASLTTYEAVRLFIARAAAVRPGFTVTNENAPAVAAITARLHGMPLAIELAAARVRLLTPDAILRRLEDQLSLLAAGSRDLPERQQTLRGAIAWSYELLDDPSRLLLERLSVFRGSFDLEAAEAVAAEAGGNAGIDVLGGLEALADQSLIRTLDASTEPRFEMLETIREFAADRLDAAGNRADVQRRHAAWTLALLQRAEPELSGADQRAWLERLELDHDNLRAAMDWAVAGADAPLAIGLGFAAWRFWQKRGHLSEARRRLDEIDAKPWSRDDPVLRARLLEALGGVAWWQGDIRSMKPVYAEAVDIWRRIGDRAELANALYNYSFAFSVPESGRLEEAGLTDPDGTGAAATEEALAIYREIGDERGEANVLWGRGNTRYFAHREAESIEDFDAALQKFRRVGDRTMEAWSLHMLGGAQVRLGQLDAAGENLGHALRHFWEAGDAAGVTLVLDDLSSLALARDELERAARLWGAARNLTNATGATLAGIVDGWLEQQVRPNVRKRLDEEEVARLAAEGARMSLDEAVAFGLEVGVTDLAPHVEVPA